MPIIVPFSKGGFFDSIECSKIPEKGEYIQITGQKFLGYRVESVILLQKNSREWDAVIVVGNAENNIEYAEYIQHVNRQQKHADQEKMRNSFRIDWERKQEGRLDHPSGGWKRRHDIFERMENGEKAEDIAAEMKVQAAWIKTMYRDWKWLIDTVADIRKKRDEKKDT